MYFNFNVTPLLYNNINIFASHANNTFFTMPLFGMTNTMPFMPLFSHINPFRTSLFNFSMPSLSKIPIFNYSIPKIGMTIKSKAKKVKKEGTNFVEKAISSVTNGVKGIIDCAKKYLGFNEKDGSYLKFTNGRREAWCADFVSYISKEAGIKGPSSSSVEGIRQWGIKNGKYSTNTAKVGDAIILKGKGASHTGIVEKVGNGKVTCIAGNTSNKVKRITYSLNDPRVSGFVTLA
ncbi:CHAP domain-containing protein [bacterium]|nr:CHAP domain-containing protein [bacterium]